MSEEKKLELNHWVHPKTGKHRFYIQNWKEAIGLSIDYYKSGNVCAASLNGIKISNSRAGRISMKLWFDTEKKLHVDHLRGAGVITAYTVRWLVGKYVEACGGLTLPEPFNNDRKDTEQ